MMVFIRFRNLDVMPRTFRVHILRILAPGRGYDKLTTIEDTEACDPGQVREIEFRWSYSVKPQPPHVEFKAPPENSLAFRLEEWAIDGVSILKNKDGMLA